MNNALLTHALLEINFDKDFRNLQMRKLAEKGGEYIVLGNCMLKYVFAAASPLEALNELKQEVAAAGLKFADAHAIFGPEMDMNCPLPEKRENLLKIHKKTLEYCNDCGVNTITIHVGNPRFPGCTLQQYRDCIRQSLEELLPVAEKNGVIICIENIWFPTNTPDELLAYLKYFNTPYLGMCYDSGHANLMSKPIEDPAHPSNVGWQALNMTPQWENNILEQMLPYIVNCHLHDNMGDRDSHLIPFSGNVDWEKTMKTLAKAPNLRWLQNEVILREETNSSVTQMIDAFDKLMLFYRG